MKNNICINIEVKINKANLIQFVKSPFTIEDAYEVKELEKSSIERIGDYLVVHYYATETDDHIDVKQFDDYSIELFLKLYSNVVLNNYYDSNDLAIIEEEDMQDIIVTDDIIEEAVKAIEQGEIVDYVNCMNSLSVAQSKIRIEENNTYTGGERMNTEERILENMEIEEERYYFNDIEDSEQIETFDNNDLNFDGEDEEGLYWTDKEEFEFWQETAEALEYLINHENLTSEDLNVNEYGDYKDIANYRKFKRFEEEQKLKDKIFVTDLFYDGTKKATYKEIIEQYKELTNDDRNLLFEEVCESINDDTDANYFIASEDFKLLDYNFEGEGRAFDGDLIAGDGSKFEKIKVTTIEVYFWETNETVILEYTHSYFCGIFENDINPKEVKNVEIRQEREGETLTVNFKNRRQGSGRCPILYTSIHGTWGFPTKLGW